MKSCINVIKKNAEFFIIQFHIKYTTINIYTIYYSIYIYIKYIHTNSLPKLSMSTNVCLETQHCMCVMHLSAGLLTLCGVSLYIIYSNQALAETERLVGPEVLAQVHTSFGWSLDMAWLSYGLELLTGVLLLIAARMIKRQHSSPSMA